MSNRVKKRRFDRRPITSGLPPDKRTFSEFVGMSQRCQKRKSQPITLLPAATAHLIREGPSFATG
jgi:hypothetical protein